MKDITLADISQVISSEVRAVVRGEVHTAMRKELVDFEVRLWPRLDTKLDERFNKFRDELDERFNEVLDAIGEEHEKLVAAIGGHTVELADHGRRIKQLEKLTT